MSKTAKKRNKKINSKRALISESYRDLRRVKNEDVFLISLKKLIKNPFTRPNFLPNKKNFQDNLVDEKMYCRGESLNNDLIWTVEVITYLAESLSSYISVREQVEEKILNGDYSGALILVEEIKERFGFSYWYLENKFSLLSRLGREEELYVYLREIKKSFTEYSGRDASLLMEKSLVKKSTSRFEFMIQSILDNVEEDSIDFDAISFIFKFDVNQKYNFSNLFRTVIHLNIVDIYNSFIRITSYSLVNNLKLSDVCIEYLKEIKNILKDPKVDNLLQYTNHEYDTSSDYHVMCENYISGDFENVIISFEHMEKPLTFRVVFIELYVKSLIYLNREPKHFFDGVFDELIDYAYQITCSFDECHNQTLDDVACQFTQSDYPYSLKILKLKMTNSSKESVDREYRLVDILINYNNPFRPEIELTNSICSGYTAKNINNLSDKIPKFRFNKWKGDELFDACAYVGALELYEQINDVPRYLQLEILEKRILIHYELGNVNDVVSIIVDLYLSENLTLKRLPLFDIKEKVLNSESLNRKSINTPIFAYVLKLMGLSNNQKVALLCDDFIYLNKLTTAKDITIIDDKVEFLFLKVMSVEVLNRQDFKDRNLDDFINRALLLHKVLKQRDNSESLSNEIEYLVSQYSRKLFKNELGRGKISINIDAIKLIIKNKFNNDFLDILKTDLNVDNENNVEFSSAYLKIREFVLNVRDLYATHEAYGLENSLNTDIRHNGIVPTLRVVFEENEVICNKKKDTYLNNLNYEKNCKNSLNYRGYNLFQSKIKEFSEQIDTLLNSLKSKYLHVFTNDLDEKEKLFKLTIDHNDVLDVMKFVKSTQDLSLAIDYIFELLNKKTAQAMNAGAAVLQLGIKNKVDGFISSLIDGLNKSAKVNSGFIENLRHAKNQFSHVIFEVSDWLDFSKKSADDFPLQIPIDEALDFVKKTHPMMNITLEYSNHEKPYRNDYKGEYLATYIRMFLILFQNAAKSKTKSSTCRLKVDYVVNNNVVSISVSNDYDSIDLDLIDKIKSSLNEGKILEGASKGSGSGIFKVKKMLEYELKVDNKLNIRVDEVNKIFNLVISYDSTKIREA
ncbi:hypothetical protein [Paraglaciecola sp. L1A13]|uniref:hypothetical protein n=1 Tax=Paraglaciecola sp. L1A13 TaxID=2686359 RepID=UPI00131C4602|nr:hypothetical protein [Paraglaciecola sp. L1A13]